MCSDSSFTVNNHFLSFLGLLKVKNVLKIVFFQGQGVGKLWHRYVPVIFSWNKAILKNFGICANVNHQNLRVINNFLHLCLVHDGANAPLRQTKHTSVKKGGRGEQETEGRYRFAQRTVFCSLSVSST